MSILYEGNRIITRRLCSLFVCNILQLVEVANRYAC